MIRAIADRLYTSSPFRLLSSRIEALQLQEPLLLRGIAGSLMAFVVSFLFEKLQRQILLVVPEQDHAQRLRDDLALLNSEGKVHLLLQTLHHKAKLLDMTAPVARVEALRALSTQEPVIIVASADGVVEPLPNPSQFVATTLLLEQGQEIPFQNLLERLEELGFERKDFVEGYGDYAVRGGILDVFPFIGDHPVRFEFWGDTIESIRAFDPLSQRSIRPLHSAIIVPSLTTIGSSENVSVVSYLQEDALVVLDQPELIEREIEELFNEGVPSIFPWRVLREQIESRFRIVHSMFEKENVLSFGSLPQPPVHGKIRLLLDQIKTWESQGYDVLITCDTAGEASRIKELIEEEAHQANGDSYSALGLTIAAEALHNGFLVPDLRLAVLTEHEIFGRLKRRGLAKRAAFRGITQKELSRLRRGDFVVHQDYGIGRFVGLQKIKISGVEQEVMKVEYADGDVLYVNLNFMNRVQKYTSKEGHIPQLTKLGTPQWDRLKEKAKRRVKDIARELITLYARRKLEPGFAFSPDTHWQKEMEASFMFEDTPDQAQATRDVKRDMESPTPMDRLICGDVGFGKTEVAVRAAFKAVMDGKQVAVLVPTTILAVQHFNTFTDRLGRYAVKIASLSRFKTPREQKDILAGLKEGRIDILIGTHRILSRDVEFKDLGLLIIDEEHRFGVAAKEKLRQLRATVDTLTLTATPIPRTLQFSLLGARDLSIINTPPRNRLPIITEIAQFDLRLIREAILKELHRGGQVYFIHDRIETMDAMLTMLSEHVPEARFHAAHGQMTGHELERTMMDFLDRKYDVLLCTKIIESGIDIPSVNTIIINRADRFGLAELYQLRGRVGRSNVQAYAYLLTPPFSSLPKQSLRRLQAIQEFTELGSGFNLAMRDLEIRGAGNLLGGEQSGFILEMGFEMYEKIVQEAVRELKEEEFRNLLKPEESTVQHETILETDVEAYIPDFYIESDTERLDLYRRLYRAKDQTELQHMREDLRDRFGEFPEEVEHLFQLAELRLMMSGIGVARMNLSGNDIRLTLPPSSDTRFYDGDHAPFKRLMDVLPSLQFYHLRFQQRGQDLVLSGRLKDGVATPQRLAEVRILVENLTSAMLGEKRT